MRKNISIYLLFLISLFLVFASGCKKDEYDNPANTFIDPRDGTVYKFVTIGNQTWMAENLRYLPGVAGPGTGSLTTPYYYVYNYFGTDVNAAKKTENYNTYGVLYNWTAAMSACPAGWHLPGDEEWTELADYLGGLSVAGSKLKESGTTHWADPNTGTNETEFTALPGGGRYLNGTFNYSVTFGNWWIATERNADQAWQHYAGHQSDYLFRYYASKGVGYSVRCVKDD